MNPRRREPIRIRHLKALRLWRLRQIVRTIPRDAAPLTRARWQIHASLAVAMLGRRALARVIWPWQTRPKDAGRGMPKMGRARRQQLHTLAAAGLRTPRGRLANPTAFR